MNNSKSNFAVLVTGGGGYIGSHATLSLIDNGWRVVVVDNLTTGMRSAVPPEVPFYQCDVGDAAAISGIIRKHEVGAIMHFAGSVIVPESVVNPLKYYGNNTGQSRGLMRAAVENGVRHFIFSSTAAVYGQPEVSTVSEDCATKPINPYGMSKLMTEFMLADTAKAHPLNYGVLRYFNVAGADPAGRAGQSTAGATHLIKVAVETALGMRSHIDIFGDDFNTPDGTGVRDYIHVSDLADAHVLTLEALITDPAKSLTLNCGYGQGHSVRDVLDSIERIAGISLERRVQARRLGDPASLIAANGRILSTLPWSPRHQEIDTIVMHALAWERRLSRQHPVNNSCGDRKQGDL